MTLIWATRAWLLSRIQSFLGRQLVVNGGSNLLRGVISGLVTVTVTGLAARTLDRDTFGYWGLMFGLSSSLGATNLGISTALRKLVAECAEEDVERLGRVTTSGLAAVVLLAVIVMVGLGWFGVRLASSFRGAEDAAAAGLFAANGGVLLVSSCLSGILIGRQRTDLVNFAHFAGLVCYGCLAVLGLSLRLGLVALAAASLCNALAVVAVNVLQIRRVIPGLVPKLAYIRLTELRDLIQLGGHVQWVAIVSIVHANLDKLLLSHFWGVGSVSHYELASRVVSQARSVPLLLVEPILPAASQTLAQGSREGWVRLRRKATEVGLVVSLGVFGTLALLSRPVVELLAGQPDDVATLLLMVLSVGAFANALTAPSFLMLLGAGQPLAGSIGATVGLVIHVACALILVPQLGPLGGASANSAALVLGALAFWSAAAPMARRVVQGKDRPNTARTAAEAGS